MAPAASQDMTDDQQQLAESLIARIGRCVQMEERGGGYEVWIPDFRRIGHVRFNVKGKDQGKYSVYAYYPFSDPREKFQNNHGNQRNDGWRCVVGPGNEEDLRYAIRVLESSYDMKQSQAR